MTRLILIEAGPTPWDAEDRLVGNHTLPLAPGAAAVVAAAVANIEDPVDAVYCSAANEATAQAAKLVADRYKLRPRDVPDLEEVALGLWQGLTRTDARFRFPSAFDEWTQNPAGVRPPEGEPLERAVERFRAALRKVLRRNRDKTLALALRPMGMQITLGLLRDEPLAAIAGHLHNREGIATIEVADDSKFFK